MQRQKGLLFAWKTRQPSEKFRFWDGSYGLQWGTSLTTDLIETVKITMVRKKHTLLCCFKIKIALNHTQSSIFETYLHSRKVPRLSNGGSREKQRIDEGSKYSSNCCKNGSYSWLLDCQIEAEITVELWDPVSQTGSENKGGCDLHLFPLFLKFFCSKIRFFSFVFLVNDLVRLLMVILSYFFNFLPAGFIYLFWYSLFEIKSSSE